MGNVFCIGLDCFLGSQVQSRWFADIASRRNQDACLALSCLLSHTLQPWTLSKDELKGRDRESGVGFAQFTLRCTLTYSSARRDKQGLVADTRQNERRRSSASADHYPFSREYCCSATCKRQRLLRKARVMHGPPKVSSKNNNDNKLSPGGMSSFI
jgi:hypothetical protein